MKDAIRNLIDTLLACSCSRYNQTRTRIKTIVSALDNFLNVKIDNVDFNRHAFGTENISVLSTFNHHHTLSPSSIAPF